MKLRNKKTGEIGYLIVGRGSDHYVVANNEWYTCGKYDSLAELNEEWEDYEEPKGITDICLNTGFSGFWRVQIDYDNKEEAERAVEKLKAWRRLKDGGITFKNWSINQTGTIDCFATWGDKIPPSRKDPFLQEDLDLLFGGEE